MGRYIDHRPKLSARRLREKTEQEARERQAAEDHQIMEKLLYEEAQNRLKAETKAREEKELRHKNLLEVRKAQSEARAKQRAIEVE